MTRRRRHATRPDAAQTPPNAKPTTCAPSVVIEKTARPVVYSSSGTASGSRAERAASYSGDTAVTTTSRPHMATSGRCGNGWGNGADPGHRWPRAYSTPDLRNWTNPGSA